jgi:hypothetical protein
VLSPPEPLLPPHPDKSSIGAALEVNVQSPLHFHTIIAPLVGIFEKATAAVPVIDIEENCFVKLT